MLLPVEGRLGFRGGATIYRDRQTVDVQADLLCADNPDGSKRWWGTYSLDSEEDQAALQPGTVYMRFSDGSDAQVNLMPGDGRRGSFEVIKLGTLEPDMTRWRGTRREASAQDPLDDWPKPAGT
jgi:hypothetical protein